MARLEKLVDEKDASLIEQTEEINNLVAKVQELTEEGNIISKKNEELEPYLCSNRG